MWFFYDSQGQRVGLNYNGYDYYYIYNLQGDVAEIMRRATGEIVATYQYDAWGKCIRVENKDGYTIGDTNPFRYRGYYYDTESGLYYLNSRYYNPEVGRFINADDSEILFENQDNILENNLYTYCLNNPINYKDSSGYAATMTLRMGTQFALKGLGKSALLSLAGSITPTGWVVISVVIVGGIVYAKTKKAKTKQEVDPYARPGQKKQGREKKNKSRRNDNFEDRSNKRTKKPLPHHTPGKVHQKYNQKR